MKAPADADKNPKQAWDKVLAAKLASEKTGSITAGLPTEFDVFFRYTRNLAFDDLPDYEGCRKLFRGLAKREGIAYDGIFDWTVVGERVWRRVSHGGTGSGRGRRFCEACEARAAMEADGSSISLSRRS